MKSETEMQEMVGKFGGGEFSKKLSEMNIDLEDSTELKRIAQGLVDGNFEVTRKLKGDEDLKAVFNQTGVEGLEFTRKMGDIPFDLENGSFDDLKNLATGLMEGGFEVHKKLGNEMEFNETIGKFGGVDVDKRLSDINIDFDNEEQVKSLMKGFQDGNFELTREFTGKEDLG